MQFINFHFLKAFARTQMEEFWHVGMLTPTIIFIRSIFFIVLVLIKVGVERTLFLFCFRFETTIAFDMNCLVVWCRIADFARSKFEPCFEYGYCFIQSDRQPYGFYFSYPALFLSKRIQQPLELRIWNEFK